MRVPRRSKRFEELVGAVGPGLVLRGRPAVERGSRVRIGTDVSISSQPAMTHLATGPNGRIDIGDRVRIAHGAALSALAAISIGEDSVLGAFVMVMDSDFHVAGDRTQAPAPSPVTIGRGVRLGQRVIVLPGSDIRDGAVVAPGAVVSGRVPAGAVVAGNPAVAAGGADTASGTSVGGIVAAVFGLERPAASTMRPDDVSGWDSLGALRLLLQLEAAFEIRLDDRDLADVRSVGDLERLVASAAATHASRVE
jgi:acetyltransferase-like isoleucine patch superfamily enzyme/acyl carrier protein